ncbi:hypothetical protein LCGC14_1016690 [marine sediment metagenome]|uniref:DUF2116 family Zn-ribbon domain-containing protein n=1 Tax=marine sediment metagenome TaxID=412755 RepID=A0A0F9N388_9ZZZZ
MPPKRCMGCGTPFFTKKSNDFCSSKCKQEFKIKLKKSYEVSGIQIDKEYEEKERNKNKDYRLRRI